MITQLLDQNTDIKRRIEAGWRVKGLLKQNIDIDCLSRNRVGSLPEGGQRLVRIGQIPQQLAHLSQGGNLVLYDEIGHTRLTVHRRATQLIGRDVLAQHAFDDTRAGQTKKSVFGLDEEAPLTREVTAPTGVKAKHAHDAGHDAADLS